MKGTTLMTYKEFGEEAEIEYITQVFVNGVLAGTVSAYSEDCIS